MQIKQSVINTFKRCRIPYQNLMDLDKVEVVVRNRFGYGECTTNPLIAYLIKWVYQTSNQYEEGVFDVNVSDFDRVRYFILDKDQNAYWTCID
jgi:hypothetical protein